MKLCRKIGRTGDHHVERETQLKKPDITSSCSFMEFRPKMMLKMLIIMEYECK
jgi:hypothetical protein